MTRICVVHLVRAANGLEPFARFLDSYMQANPVLGQELALLFKGFEGQSDLLAACKKLLGEQPYHALSVADVGFDIEPYFHAARTLDTDYCCFLNSYSVILDPDWTTKMMCHIRREGIGIVGATASLLSYRDYYDEHKMEFTSKPPYNTALGRLRFALVQRMYHRWFAPFPNPFIRTNAFLVARDVMCRVHCPPIRKKTHAYRFESGVNGLTRQIQSMGLRPLVVGQDGKGYEIEEWHSSRTFMQSKQENLLVSDNQTRYYDTGDDALRLQISRNSWGSQAAPAPLNPMCSQETAAL